MLSSQRYNTYQILHIRRRSLGAAILDNLAHQIWSSKTNKNHIYVKFARLVITAHNTKKAWFTSNAGNATNATQE